MKITKRQLRRIIREEKQKLLRERVYGGYTGDDVEIVTEFINISMGTDDVSFESASEYLANHTGRSIEDADRIVQSLIDRGIISHDTRNNELYIQGIKMKITKRQLRRIIKEEKAKLLNEQAIDADSIIAQGRAFFDRLIELSMASEDDPAAQTALDQIDAALSGDVAERSFGYIKLNILQ